MRIRSAPLGDISMAEAARRSFPVSARATVKLNRQAHARARMWEPSSVKEPFVESGDEEARSSRVSNMESITDPESCNFTINIWSVLRLSTTHTYLVTSIPFSGCLKSQY